MKRTITTLIAAAVLLVGLPKAYGHQTVYEARSLSQQGRTLKTHFGAIPSHDRLPVLSPNGRQVSAASLLQEKPVANSKMPARITAGGSDLYGWSATSQGYPKQIGYCIVGPESVSMLWDDSFYTGHRYTMSNGYLIDDVLYGNAVQYSSYGISAQTWNKYDAASGALLESQEWDIFTDKPFYSRLAYNPDDDHVYATGLFVPYDGGQTTVFMKAPASDPSAATVICEVPEGEIPSGICYVQPEKCFYVINSEGALTKWDTAGNITKVYDVSVPDINFNPSYFLGMVYSPVEKRIFITPYGSYGTCVASLDPSEPGVSVEYRITRGNQLMFLVTADDVVKDPQKPAMPQLVSYSFPQGATSGYVTYQMPDTTVTGEPITGTLTVIASVDGIANEEVTVAPGAEFNAEFNGLSNGMHIFACQAVQDGHKGKKLVDKHFIGAGTPNTPYNIVLTGTRISWDPVTTAANEGYVDYDSILYKVYLNEEFVGETYNSYLDINLSEDEPIKSYEGAVSASFRGNESYMNYSNVLTYGKPLELPVTITPTFEEYQISSQFFGDGTYDGQWFYDFDNTCYYTSMNWADCDSWVVLPPFTVDEDGKYITISYEAKVNDPAASDQTLSVYSGTSPDAAGLANCVVSAYTPCDGTAAAYEKKTATFLASKGTNYVAFRMQATQIMQYGMAVRNIHIADYNITGASPAAVTGLNAEPADNGVLNAAVSFTLPTKTIDGADLDANADLNVVVADDVETKTLTGKPGETLSVELATAQSKVHELNLITVYTEAGELTSPRATTEVYTGVYAPTYPIINQVEEDATMTSMTIGWEPVTTTFEPGKFLDPSTVTYDIYHFQGIFGNPEKIDGDLTGHNYTYTVDASAPMAIETVGVAAVNEAGSCGTVNVAEAILGKPYELPISERLPIFPELDPWVAVQFGENYLDELLSMGLSELIPGGTEDEGAFMFFGRAGYRSCLGVPRFSTIDCSGVELEFGMVTDDNAPEVVVFGDYYGCEEKIEVGRFTPTGEPGVKTFKLTLPAELLGKYWVGLYLDCEYTSDDQFFALSEFRASNVENSGVSLVSKNCSVIAGNGTVTVTGYEGAHVAISSVDGRQLANGVMTASKAVYAVVPGVCIVTVDGKPYKVLVK